MGAISVNDALKKYDKRLYSLKVDDKVIKDFLDNTQKYIYMVNNAISKGESEEHLKNYTNGYLKHTFFLSNEYEINTDKRIDSAIKENGEFRVLIENKNPKNVSEMVSSENVNVKSLHEILYYYMNITRDVGGAKVRRIPNMEIRRVIITDSVNFAIIDANEIEKLVDGYLEKLFYKYKNDQLVYSRNTDKFYADEKSYLDSIDVNSKLPYVFFNLPAYAKSKHPVNLYKIFNRNYLLKQNIRYNESIHTLNEKFYQELLYLMGLKEKTGKYTKTIIIDRTIKNSLADQVYNILENDKEYPENDCIDKTFELVIVWMNRLLFIKLFEGQLVSFNGDLPDYHILDNEKIESFQDLQSLFFDVLGKKERDTSPFLEKFKNIPYLNSSLFERYKVEKQDVNINAIKNLPVKKKKNSVVGNKTQTEVPLLEYIIGFLNGYSFSSEITKNNTIIAGRDIIDSSVLGLIFEKLNGYADGSFYTPSVITEYMCMRSIEDTVINLINEKKQWKCADLFEIKEMIGSSFANKKDINDIINTLKIGDISVGSGHFLVSALNRIIAIKKQLGVLFKYGRDELLTEYDIDIVDDVLKIYDGQGKPFSYDKDNVLSQQVQETLFEEKRVIIENCLFGVDINPKATAICQLRLWIELLKNAYYKNGVMQTLPNIDINIRAGNSLLNKMKFDIQRQVGWGDTEIGKKTKSIIKDYRRLVSEYKGTSEKSVKADILFKIAEMKEQLNPEGVQTSIDINGVVHGNENELIYKGAFEWAIEFPELLDERGVFLGFDCIIGNPPYGIINKKQNQNTSISVSDGMMDFYKKTPLYEEARAGNLNIFKLFIQRCHSLIRKNGRCCLIFPLAFMGDSTCSKIRQFVMENDYIDFIEAFPERDIESKRVFKEAKISVCILGFSKRYMQPDYKFGVRIHHNKYVDENNSIMSISYNEVKAIDGKYLSIPLIKEHELPIFLSVTDNCKRMKEIGKCYTGEVDMTIDKDYITTDTSKAPMLRGAQVQKYFITNDISQGEVFYLDIAGYLGNRTGERVEHHKNRRIVMQGITGVNEKWRLKMTMAEPPVFCANSVNYLIPPTENDYDYFILGLLNSTLLNWFFMKQSTNSNVNGYEVDGLPIKEGTEEQRNKIITLAKKALEEPDNMDIRNEIDQVVYEIYDISEYEIPIIEG